MNQRIQIHLLAFDDRILDKTLQDIVDVAKQFGAKVFGPIPIPTRIPRYIDTKGTKQIEPRIHKRLLDLIYPTSQIVNELKKLNIPENIKIQIKMF